MSQNYFNEALKSFAMDAACGDAIRHLADKGMTVEEICAGLTFPAPVDTVKSYVWKHYVNKGIIRLTDPANKSHKEVTYVQDRDKYGRCSFRRVEMDNPSENHEYIFCDFGKAIYKDRKGFEESLTFLDKNDRDYILGLPWPVEPVWHIRDERMMRISRLLHN